MVYFLIQKSKTDKNVTLKLAYVSTFDGEKENSVKMIKILVSLQPNHVMLFDQVSMRYSEKFTISNFSHDVEYKVDVTNCTSV